MVIKRIGEEGKKLEYLENFFDLEVCLGIFYRILNVVPEIYLGITTLVEIADFR